MSKAAIKVGHHVCIVCGRPFTRPYSARRHVNLKHQGYGQITSLTEYILGLAQGRYPMPTYTLPKAQQITTGKWSSNYRQGRNSIESWVKSWADYSDDLLRLARNLKMMSPNTLPNSYYYYYYHDPARQFLVNDELQLQYTTNTKVMLSRVLRSHGIVTAGDDELCSQCWGEAHARAGTGSSLAV